MMNAMEVKARYEANVEKAEAGREARALEFYNAQEEVILQAADNLQTNVVIGNIPKDLTDNVVENFLKDGYRVIRLDLETIQVLWRP
jgi:hypothetical protein